MVQYVILVVFITVALAVGIAEVGQAIDAMFQGVNATLTEVMVHH